MRMGILFPKLVPHTLTEHSLSRDDTESLSLPGLCDCLSEQNVPEVILHDV